MKLRLRWIGKPRLFAGLMGAAAVLALFPPEWTGWPRSVLQPLGWLQWSASAGARAVGDAVSGLGEEPPSAEQVRVLEGEVAELRRQLEHQSDLLTELERQMAVVSGIQGQFGQGRARIVIAAVIGYDASPRRQWLAINRGSLSVGGIEVGQWVAAGVSPEEQDAQASGRELLARQWLIGRISRVEPYRSWVQLTTDLGFGPEPVRVARLVDGQWERVDEECLLYGLGSGRLQIRHAKGDYWSSGHILVLVPRSGELPAPLSIGQISGSSVVAESPLWYDLQVEPWCDPFDLGYVYVVSSGS